MTMHLGYPAIFRLEEDGTTGHRVFRQDFHGLKDSTKAFVGWFGHGLP